MAFDPLLVLTGSFTLGGTDYSDEVTSVEIVRARDVIELPATFGTGKKSRRAGAVSEEIRINMINDVQASSLWAELWDQLDDADGELTFLALFRPGAVGATNPSFAGTCIVTGVNVGAASGDYSQNQLVFPIKGDITKAIA